MSLATKSALLLSVIFNLKVIHGISHQVLKTRVWKNVVPDHRISLVSVSVTGRIYQLSKVNYFYHISILLE